MIAHRPPDEKTTLVMPPADMTDRRLEVTAEMLAEWWHDPTARLADREAARRDWLAVDAERRRRHTNG